MIPLAGQASVGAERRPLVAREQAFAKLYEAQFGRVYAYAHFRTSDPATAEDIAAEVFMRAWSQLPDLDDPSAAAAWLFTTGRRLVVDHYRRRRPHDLASIGGSAHLESPSPETIVLARERLAVLASCLQDLSDRERDVIGLRFVARLRNREIARLVRTSEGNVAKIVHRALRKVRDRMTADGYAPIDAAEGASA